MTESSSEHDVRFIQALTQNQRSLLSFIVGMTPTMADADDVLQEVNLALWKKRHLYDGDQSFLRWAFGFAGIEIRRFRDRHAAKYLWASDAVLDSLAAAYPEDSGIVDQRRDALAGCIEKLGSEERRLITEFYARKHSAQQLADATGKTIRNVYKVLTRTRRLLRECVERSLARQSRPV